MLHCGICSSDINEDDQYYSSDNIGPDLISVLEHNFGREINENIPICSQCFANLHIEDAPIEQYELQNRHDPLVCVMCRNSLFRRRTHSIIDGPVRTFIAECIAPREIPQGGLLCYACWVHIEQTLREQGIVSSPSPNLNVCVWCQRSLAVTRRHSLPEGPERNEIMARIYPRQIPPGGLVCYACWVSARRNVQRESAIQAGQEIPGPSSFLRHHDAMCVWCEMPLHRRRTHVLNGPERHAVATSIYPRELPEHALVCENCWARAQENINIEQGILNINENLNIHNQEIMLDEFKITSYSSAHCFVPECRNTERYIVPKYLKLKILKSQKIFVADNARVCAEHIHVYDWEFLDQFNFSSVFTKNDVHSMLRLNISDDEIKFNFENIDIMDDGFFRYWTGVTKDNFNVIFNQISAALTCKTPKTALGMYLIKVRTGDSNEKIAALFCQSKSTISKFLQAAREALLTAFVPLHLGLNHITRQEIMERNLTIPEGLFGNIEQRVPIIIVDGTYVYLQKSSNYNFQKKTYSLHKFRNLVKPFLLVATDGHIIDVLGPYPATESDAQIMKALFQNENGEMRSYFQTNDVFILDRGFRDAIPTLEELGYKIFKPESLEQGETQLPTLKANKSRCVTLCRWVVEIVNGRFKRDFKIFRQDYFNVAATHLMDDFRICGSIINAFHPVITDRPDAHLILNRAIERLHMTNELAELVITNRINRFRAQFTRIDGELPSMNVFPQMSMSDLIIFSLGIYQIKQARSYYGEHLRQHGSFVVEVSDELEVIAQATPSQLDPVLLRGRIKSRHTSGRVYYTYILIARQEGLSWDEKIISYYCNCIAGQRTVGCCAHTMTIVWYLGWARYQDNIAAPASFLDGVLIRDDVENE